MKMCRSYDFETHMGCDNCNSGAQPGSFWVWNVLYDKYQKDNLYTNEVVAIGGNK